MRRLSGFPSVIYDTNCLVHYCLFVEVSVRGTKVTITDTLTIPVRQITETLKGAQQRITTIQAVFNELRNAISGAVWRRLSHRSVEEQLGYAQDQHIPDQIKLLVMRNAEKHARKLENKPWFIIDTTFMADTEALAALLRFFQSQPPAAFGQSAMPGEVDRQLINFGFQRKFPLITNDRGISNFSAELVAAGLSFQIYNVNVLTVP